MNVYREINMNEYSLSCIWLFLTIPPLIHISLQCLRTLLIKISIFFLFLEVVVLYALDSLILKPPMIIMIFLVLIDFNLFYHFYQAWL